MLPKFYIIITLCFLSNCFNEVTCDCDTFYDCVGTFLNDFTGIASNKEVNGTKISVLDLSQVEGAHGIVEDIKNLKNKTDNKEKSANILTFDFSKYFSEGLKAAEDFFKINVEKTEQDIKHLNTNTSDLKNFTEVLNEQINNATKQTKTIFENITPNFVLNFNLPLKNVEDQNDIQHIKIDKIFGNIDDIFNNNSSSEELKQYIDSIDSDLKQNITNELMNLIKDTSLNPYNNYDIPNLFKEINNTEISAENVDKILDDIKITINKLNPEVSKHVNNPERDSPAKEDKGTKEKGSDKLIYEPKIIVTKTIISPFNTTNVNKDININANDNVFDYLMDYYQEIEDNSTDYPLVDYIELYKDTTNKKVDYHPTEVNMVKQEILNSSDDEYIDNFIADTSNIVLMNISEEIPFKVKECNDTSRPSHIEDGVFPWVVAIFKKNDSNQYTYICDGALLSDRKILTAAQCVSGRSSAFNPEDLLVFAGKRSLQKIDLNEKAYKITKISLNENYTNNASLITNDLAMLDTAQVVDFNQKVQSACRLDNEPSGKLLEEVTSGWDGHGSLVPVALKVINCTGSESRNNIYCTTYNKDVTGCPSFGGIHAVKTENNNWYLKGIFSDDITKRAPFCMKRNFFYTSLKNYANWLDNNINK